MSYHWPADTTFRTVTLDVDDPTCPVCSRRMHICDHRMHNVHSFSGPLHLVNRLVRCPDPDCSAHHRTFSPESEYMITMPWWAMDWEVFAWIGHRRFARHWCVPQIREELSDTYRIAFSDDAIEKSILRYQIMLAAKERDPEVLAEEYRNVSDLVLAIDGLQPEKGHETLYVVRELRRKRVWFAESLISSSEAEVRRLFIQARQWAERLGLPVRLWISDKQQAFVTGIAAEFPDVTHRYCDNHFLRDLAKPVLEKDSHAKVQMRKKVRGLRAIERDILEQQAKGPVHNPDITVQPQPSAATNPEHDQMPESLPPDSARADKHNVPANSFANKEEEAQQVALDYCTAVRGILNNDQGGPLHPPGLRMADSLQQVRDSLDRNQAAKRGALPLPTNPRNDL